MHGAHTLKPPSKRTAVKANTPMANLATCISDKLTFKLTLRQAFIIYIWVTACLGALFLASPILHFGFDNVWVHIKEFLQHIGGLLLLWPFAIYLYFITFAAMFCMLLVEAYRLRNKANKAGGFISLLKDKQNLRSNWHYVLLLPFKTGFYLLSLVGTLYLFLILSSR